jgi:hypothetical protein
LNGRKIVVFCAEPWQPAVTVKGPS